ncbi:pyrokinin-1 receptor-like [Galleria mellonella]|uniref:Pyrokinin-1 receptor-like n=1 Tax=Galleria mellonella TaxID=7137 RepID=A0ABM3MXQ0_GALME|nr:pyrokinin-1 receptor-like [Galleria mellonella]
MSWETDDAFTNKSYSFFGPVGMVLSEENGLDNNLSVKVVLSVFLGVCMVLSIVGNVCTCAVIARDRTMRTITNCYLFNLAITDLLMAFFVPMEIYLIWIPEVYPLGEEGCRLHFILYDWLNNCSVLTISAFSLERYLVISKPFLRQTLSVKSRVYKIVAIIWVVSFAFCIPDIFYIDLVQKKKFIFCYVTLPGLLRYLMAMDLFVFFVMPMTFLFVLYVLIAIKLKSAHLRLKNSPVNGNLNRDKAVKMLAAVAASFFFCWSPYCLLRFMMVYPKFSYEDYYDIWRIVNYLCYNGYVSTVINPILYSLMSRKFRQAFKDFFKGQSKTNRPRMTSMRWMNSGV